MPLTAIFNSHVRSFLGTRNSNSEYSVPIEPEGTWQVAVTPFNHPSRPVSLPPPGAATSYLQDMHRVTLAKEVNALAVANIQLTTKIA